jgi:zinc D-Ala-D-Ala carboxypeptidase
MNHFKLSEFDCKCGCGKNNMDPSVLHKLDEAREVAGIPFTVTSGSRCDLHNKIEGGLASSAHLKGLAVDIGVNGSGTRFEILTALLLVGFTRIGIAKSFIHVDEDRTKPDNVIWMY